MKRDRVQRPRGPMREVIGWAPAHYPGDIYRYMSCGHIIIKRGMAERAPCRACLQGRPQDFAPNTRDVGGARVTWRPQEGNQSNA